jgi:hypothetical protein
MTQAEPFKALENVNFIWNFSLFPAKIDFSMEYD